MAQVLSGPARQALSEVLSEITRDDGVVCQRVGRALGRLLQIEAIHTALPPFVALRVDDLRSRSDGFQEPRAERFALSLPDVECRVMAADIARWCELAMLASPAD